MLPMGLCTFSAVPFALTDNENRPVLAIPPIFLHGIVGGDGNIDLENLAAALVQRMRGLFSLNSNVQNVESLDEQPRRPRTRHNAGSGAAEDYPMAPLPDIIVSSNLVSPTWMTDSGVNSPQDPEIFSFDDAEVANYREESHDASGIALDYVLNNDSRAWQLAPPPRGRRSASPETMDDDEGLGGEPEETGPVDDEKSTEEEKDDLKAVVVETLSSAELAGEEGSDLASGVRVDESHNGRWKQIGRNLRQISDEFYTGRTGACICAIL